MSEDSKSLLSYIQESVNLPRQNGELVFQNPWESRVFAMAVLLFQKGIYPWKVFNGRFIEEIGEFEHQHPETDVVSTYYHHWMQAFEKVILEKGLLTEEQLKSRSDEFATGQRHHVC